MDNKLEDQIRALVARAPRWIKTDLLKDGPERVRAEEALAAMIATALEPVPPKEEWSPAANRRRRARSSIRRIPEDGEALVVIARGAAEVSIEPTRTELRCRKAERDIVAPARL